MEGYIGMGWMFEVSIIIVWVVEFLIIGNVLVGKCLVVMVGGICELLDLVCFIGNCFFGKMGIVIVKVVVN